jgi:hypothetical protein
MPYTEPYENQTATYGIGATGNTTEIPGSGVQVIVQVLTENAPGPWTEAGMDELVQRLLDLLASTDFLLPGSSGWGASKTLRTFANSTGTPTEEP